MKRPIFKRILLTTITVVMVMVLSVPSALAQDVSIEQVRQEVATYTAQRGNLEKSSVGSQQTLLALEALIGRQRAAVDVATKKVEAINRQLTVLKNQRGKAMRQSYITGTSVSYLYALLDSGSLSEFLSKGTYTNLLTQRKDRAVESVDDQIAKLDQARDALVAQKVAAENQIADLQRRLEEMRKALAENADKLAQAQAYLLSLTGDGTAKDCRRFGSDTASGQYTFAGGGLGHGVGLSQFGAQGSAEHGKSYRQILGHYYPGTSIGTIGNPSVTHPDKGTEDMDSYVAGVVAGEMPGYLDHPEALRAQAVAARSFAYDTIQHGGQLDDTTATQEYSSNPSEAERRAAQDTSGQVITFNGQPVKAHYYSSSGGCTENIENVWVEAQPWHRGVNSPWEDNPNNNYWNWHRGTFSTAEMQSRLGGNVNGTLRSIRVTARGVSGRAINLEIVGSGGTTRMTGEEFEGQVGLPSTLFGFV